MSELWSLLDLESRAGFLGTGGAGLREMVEEVDEAMDAVLGDGGLGTPLGVLWPCGRVLAGDWTGLRGGGSLWEVLLEEGRETVTQSGSGLGWKGFEGL